MMISHMVPRQLLPVVLLTLALATMSMAGCGTQTQIEWVNFIKVQGIMYVVPPIGDTTVSSAIQGSKVTAVHFNVADNVHDPGYQTKDGDAAFLPVGTSIYQVIGYRQSFRLAAMWHGTLTLFEATTVPHAQTGADLLDIRNKVVRVGVLWNTNTAPGYAEQGSITDPATVASLVAMVLAAPLATTNAAVTGTQVFIAFHLQDGTETVRSLYPADHNLAGILVPDGFVQAIQPFLPPPTAVATALHDDSHDVRA